MPDEVAATFLYDLQGIIQQTLGPRRTPDGQCYVPDAAHLQLQTVFLLSLHEECTPLKVFGCEPGGLLPSTKCSADDCNQVCVMLDSSFTVA